MRRWSFHGNDSICSVCMKKLDTVVLKNPERDGLKGSVEKRLPSGSSDYNSSNLPEWGDFIVRVAVA